MKTLSAFLVTLFAFFFTVVSSLNTPAAMGSHAPEEGFKTPSGNIECYYMDFSGHRDYHSSERFLRCDIHSGLKPEPSRTQEGDICELDWTGLSLDENGASASCAGDTVAGDHPKLAYGKTWARDGFRCHSERKGITCKNPQGKGFFLSRERWATF